MLFGNENKAKDHIQYSNLSKMKNKILKTSLQGNIHVKVYSLGKFSITSFGMLRARTAFI